MLMIVCISDKIDFENIMKEAHKSYALKYYQKGSDKRLLNYQMGMVNVFLKRLKKTDVITFKKLKEEVCAISVV